MMTQLAVGDCPVCGSTHHDVEPLQHREPLAIAGVPADLGDVDFSFVRCRSCTLAFKWPLPAQAEVDRCYAAADSGHWKPVSAEMRRFDEFAADIGVHHRSGRILDVGCASGDFLAYLPSDYDKFGIEPGAAAAAMAETKGVTILGADLTDLDATANGTFNVIVAFDVLEHVAEPRSFLQAIRRLLTDDGVACILTGDTDCRGWQLEGGDYWYSALPEHIVFFNEKSLTEVAKHTDLQVRSFRRTRHKRYDSRQIATEALRNTAFIAAKKTGTAARFGSTFDRSAPVWESGQNHFVAVLTPLS